MKTPAWVWDWKQKRYLALPPGLTQFSDGKWGFTSDPWPEEEMLNFHRKYEYLFRFDPDHMLLPLKRVVLKPGPGQKKYQPNKDKARITKVQR